VTVEVRGGKTIHRGGEARVRRHSFNAPHAAIAHRDRHLGRTRPPPAPVHAHRNDSMPPPAASRVPATRGGTIDVFVNGVRCQASMEVLAPVPRGVAKAGGLETTPHPTDVDSPPPLPPPPPPRSRVCMGFHGKLTRNCAHVPRSTFSLYHFITFFTSVRVLVLNDPAARWGSGGRRSTATRGRGGRRGRQGYPRRTRGRERAGAEAIAVGGAACGVTCATVSPRHARGSLGSQW